MALTQRRTQTRYIHHSYQGEQYAAHDLVKELKEHEFRTSNAILGNLLGAF